MIKLRIEFTRLNRSFTQQKQRVLSDRVDYFDDDVPTFISDFGDANDLGFSRGLLLGLDLRRARLVGCNAA
jgi:hypothetical protein